MPQKSQSLWQSMAFSWVFSPSFPWFFGFQFRAPKWRDLVGADPGDEEDDKARPSIQGCDLVGLFKKWIFAELKRLSIKRPWGYELVDVWI